MRYLNRYLAGEYEAVWAELRAMGPEVITSPHAGDARAVADALMSRVKANLERIAGDLAKLGYQFGTADGPSAHITIDEAASNARRASSQALQDLEGSGLPPDQVKMLQEMALQLEKMAERASAPLPDLPVLNMPSAAKQIRRPLGEAGLFADQVASFEQEIGALSFALIAFWRDIGHADFEGRFSGARTDMRSGEPLLVLPPTALIDSYRDWEYEFDDDDEPEVLPIDLIPDPREPQDCITVSAKPGVDALLSTGEWFVDHLRRATRAACFPGIARSDMSPELRRIADGWQPF
jgi:hypothetical protein